MKLKLEKDPEVYLSGSGAKWTIINQGMPLCDYKKTPAEALEVAKMYKLQPHTFYWDTTDFVFMPRSDADHFQAAEAAAFSLMPPTPPAAKDTTLNLF